MARRLKIDLDQLDTSINNYDNSINDFEALIKMIDGSLDNLKNSGWKSPAKDAFFSQYDDKWKQNMQTHISVLKHLKECLVNTKSDYIGIINEIPSISSALG